MKGITEERLREILVSDQSFYDNATVQDLIQECNELNPWQPIDENTPKDREILGWLLDQYRSIIHWGQHADRWVDDNGDAVTPTHWQELPEDPK